MIDGRRILVDRECGRTVKGWKPRRLGGGFGGHKESGQYRFGGRSDGGGGYRPFRTTFNPKLSFTHRRGFDDSFRSRVHAPGGYSGGFRSSGPTRSRR